MPFPSPYDEGCGRAYLMFGDDDLPDQFALFNYALKSDRKYQRVGYAVGAAGDFDGDGLRDIGVTASGDGGRAYVIYGRGASRLYFLDEQTLGADDGLTILGDVAAGITSVGDVNGDGLADVGVAGEDGAAIIFGRGDRSAEPVLISELDGMDGFRIPDATSYGLDDRRMTALGDVNGDGLDDMAIGVPSLAPGGGVLIVFGSRDAMPASIDPETIDPSMGARIRWTEPSAGVGLEVSPVGDASGDGFDDLLVRGSLFSDCWLLLLGGPDRFAQDIELPADDPDRVVQFCGDEPGFSPPRATAAGDVNGDGRADLLFGQTTGLLGARGRAYVVFGRSPCPADLDGDGALTIFDFLAFGNLFDLMDPRADFDGDGVFTFLDFLAFQNAFDAGCE